MFVAVAPAPAEILTFVATGAVKPGMNGANEFPANGSAGTGTGLVTWDTATNSMTVNVVFSGLSGTTTAAHIHCCVSPTAAVPNAGVATTVPFFPGFPLGVTGGVYSHPFNMLDASSYNPAFLSLHGGLPTSEAFLFSGIVAGQSYLNVHSTVFPGGEIRGFLVRQVDISIKPTAAPPVPVNPGSHGTIPVAILSSASFNAVTQVDTNSLTFGRTGSEDSLGFCNPGGEDVNGDGLSDLVCHFRAQQTGFASGDTLGVLKGKTTSGSPFIAQEAIVTVGN